MYTLFIIFKKCYCSTTCVPASVLYEQLALLPAHLAPPESSKPSKSSTPVLFKQSARWQVSKELYQTESNYVGILSTILQVVSVCMWTINTPSKVVQPVVINGLNIGLSRESDSWPVRVWITCLYLSFCLWIFFLRLYSFWRPFYSRFLYMP